jgi:hypothetical protein
MSSDLTIRTSSITRSRRKRFFAHRGTRAHTQAAALRHDRRRAIALSRKRDIEAAIAAHNDTNDREQVLLPPDAAWLLAVMFPRGTVFRGAVGSLVAKGFDNRTLPLLLRALVAAGFLSKDPGRRGLISTYHLHLPPVRP